jgi:hypothetical protein
MKLFEVGNAPGSMLRGVQTARAHVSAALASPGDCYGRERPTVSSGGRRFRNIRRRSRS